MTTINSLNITQAGLVRYNGAGVFTGVVVNQYDVLVGAASNGITSVSPSTSTYVLTSNGTSANPTFQAISASGAITTIDGDSGSMTPSSGVVTISGGTTGLTTSASAATMDLTGILKLANGGTNADLTASNGGIFYSTATMGAILPGTATANQALLSGSSTAPAWSTTTFPATTTANQILYSSSANTITGLSTANNGVLITGTTGVPSILADGTTGQVLTATTGSPPSWENPATSGTVTSVSVVTANGFAGTVANATTTPAITLTTTATGVLSGNGTAISGSLVTQYDILVAGASNAISSVGPGTSGQILQSGGNASNPAYSTSTYPSTNAINTLLYASSANTMAALATADNGVLITSASGVPSWLSDGTTGQVLTATTGSPPSWETPTTNEIAYTNVNHGASPYTVLSTDEYLSVDASGGTVTLNFPNSPTYKQTWIVKDRLGYASTNNITITTPGGTVTFDGVTSYAIISNYGAINLIANATPTYEVY